MSLPTIAASALPRIAYSHGLEHDPKLTLPENFRPVRNSQMWPKPEHGGLWTAPVTKEGPGGRISRTAWTDFCSWEGIDTGPDAPRFLEIVPNPDARVLIIDTLADFKAILAVYGLVGFGPTARLFPEYPNWEHMVADAIDAVYLTDMGQAETRLPASGDPSLYGWDVATVLWIRPTYQVTV